MSATTETSKNFPLLRSVDKTNCDEFSFNWNDCDYTAPIGFTPTYKQSPSAKLHGSKSEDISKLTDLLLPNNWHNTSSKERTYFDDGSKKSIEFLLEDTHEEIISVSVGNNQIVLPAGLKHIVDEINDSKDLLLLEDNWNDEGALAISEEILLRAIHLIVNYSKWILNNLGITISAPIISPLPDGSLDLKWHTPRARLLLNVKNNDKMEAHYYGDFFTGDSDEDSPIKGKISTNNVQSFFAHWMVNLRK